MIIKCDTADSSDITFIALPEKVDGDTVYKAFTNFSTDLQPNQAKMTREESPDYLLNGVVIPNLRVLLHELIGTIDASIPNKDQNKAVKHIVRTRFDGAYHGIVSGFHPNTTYGYGPGYVITPASNLYEAMATDGIPK